MFEEVKPAPDGQRPPEEAAPAQLPLPGADLLFAFADPPGNLSPTGPELNETSAESTEPEAAPSALDDWKDALRQNFEEWLQSLDEIPEPADDEADNADAPDLYSFYEQLAAGNVEARKSNRRTAEAFSQWGETLSKFDGDLRLLREHLARQPATQDDALPRPWCLALVEILDRLHRLGAAFATTPRKAWWGSDTRWRKAWETQRQGLDILLSHVEALLQKAGLARIPTLHEPFDPTTMAAVATVPSAAWPPQTVLEEVTAGYRLHGELLRVAQVKIAANQ